MSYKFKGLPTKTVDGFELPDADAYPEGIDSRLATAEYPGDLGRMSDPATRLQAGQTVELREIVEAGEPGAGPIREENYVVEWDEFTYQDLNGETATGYRRAMSFTKEQFEALFEEVK